MKTPGDALAQAADFLVGQFDQMGFEVEKVQVRPDYQSL